MMYGRVVFSQLLQRAIVRSFFFFQAEDGIRDGHVTGVQTCALPIYCCSPLCMSEPLGQPCGAPDVCVNNACDGAGTCAFVNFTAAPCNDANVCTVADTCTLGACVGAPNTCDDANVCTTDFCTPPAVGCGHLNNALACNDGNATTSGDSCS